MNFLAIMHVVIGLIGIGLGVPLMKRKIGMNHLYGIRVKKAFESEQLWYDINAYGGKLFLLWGVAIMITGLVGMTLPRSLWITYQWAALMIILGGLAVVVFKITGYAKTLTNIR